VKGLAFWKPNESKSPIPAKKEVRSAFGWTDPTETEMVRFLFINQLRTIKKFQTPERKFTTFRKVFQNFLSLI
jgi:hypothetical protein